MGRSSPWKLNELLCDCPTSLTVSLFADRNENSFTSSNIHLVGFSFPPGTTQPRGEVI